MREKKCFCIGHRDACASGGENFEKADVDKMAPSDEGAGFCGAKDRGREKTDFRISPSVFALRRIHLPRQREEVTDTVMKKPAEELLCRLGDIRFYASKGTIWPRRSASKAASMTRMTRMS